MPDPNLIAINVGNSRLQVGRFLDGQLEETQHFDKNQLSNLTETVVDWWARIADQPQASIALASVNDSIAKRAVSMIEDQLSVEVYRVGDDLPVPVGEQLDPETLTGVDRLLNAAAAFDVIKQACIVIDAGTAITVDFVDGQGTFQGGAIAPGAQLQLKALHEHTSALPELDFIKPDDEAFGRSTAQAMLQGVFHGLRGLAWKLSEQYAQSYGAYPTIIATGGDAHALFDQDELVDRIIDDLTLMGIAVAVRITLETEQSA